MQVCPVNAIDVDPATGAKIVLDPVCVGCKLCVIACPFGTIFFDASSETAAKCDLCAGDPACARACPTGAIQSVSGDASGWVGEFGAHVDAAYRRATAGGAP
jgi:Fe-S-cluster-containing hydrogenase component 2